MEMFGIMFPVMSVSMNVLHYSSLETRWTSTGAHVYIGKTLPSRAWFLAFQAASGCNVVKYSCKCLELSLPPENHSSGDMLVYTCHSHSVHAHSCSCFFLLLVYIHTSEMSWQTCLGSSLHRLGLIPLKACIIGLVQSSVACTQCGVVIVQSLSMIFLLVGPGTKRILCVLSYTL